jgi:membrane protease YdiL (CAAX protease family)
MGEGDTLINALIGGVVAIVASVIPAGTVLGGAVAGYLEGGSRSDGALVGAYAGLVALLPLVVFGIFLLFILGIGYLGSPRMGLSFLLFAFVMFVVSAVYSVGLCAVGGFLGNYVRYDTDLFDGADK